MVDPKESLSALLSREEVYKTSDYLKTMQGVHRGIIDVASSSEPINQHWREKIADWNFRVVDYFLLQRETVSISLNYVDRYLSVFPTSVDRNLYTLLCLTCLCLAIKLNDYDGILVQGTKSTMETVLRLCNGLFTLKQMEQMEYDVLVQLNWHVHPPVPQDFLKHFFVILSIENSEFRDLALFMVEMTVMDYYFVTCKPSHTSMAAILNTREMMSPDAIFNSELNIANILLDCDSPEVRACRERLAALYALSNDQNDAEKSGISSSSDSHNDTSSPVSVHI